MSYPGQGGQGPPPVRPGIAQPRDLPAMPFPLAGPGAGDGGWSPVTPPSKSGLTLGLRRNSGDVLDSPRLPNASPLSNVANPLGQGMSPNLTTPTWSPASETPMFLTGGNGAEFGRSPGMRLDPSQSSGRPPAPDAIGSLSQIDSWAWEMGSDMGSIPSAWSKATSSKTGRSVQSRMSSASGADGLIPGLVDGQRLSSVKPSSVPTRGGKVIVSLRREVPQGFWNEVSIVLNNLPVSVTLQPTGIKKGKKLCIEVPPGMKPGDYDVCLKFGGKIIHGSIALSIRDDDDEEEMDEDDEDLRDLAGGFKRLAVPDVP